MTPRSVAVLGSTGSIGTQALEVVAAHPDRFTIAALSAGGHLRVGMEDNVVFARGQQVQHNAELVARAAELAATMQRPPMSTTDARELLGIKPRR